jgi:hypothetical protein
VLRAGHGRTDDADTVRTVPKNVRTKRDEIKDRRVEGAIRGIGITGGIVVGSRNVLVRFPLKMYRRKTEVRISVLRVMDDGWLFLTAVRAIHSMVHSLSVPKFCLGSGEPRTTQRHLFFSCLSMNIRVLRDIKARRTVSIFLHATLQKFERKNNHYDLRRSRWPSLKFSEMLISSLHEIKHSRQQCDITPSFS